MRDQTAIRMLVLSLTGACNFACRYCYAAEHPPTVLTLADAQQAIDLAGASGEPFVLQFSGGEPLLAWERLQEIVSYVKKRRYPARLQLQTNASLFTPDIARSLQKMGCGIGISLDGRPAVNDAVRCWPDGSGTTPAILAGAAILAAAGIEIGMTCVVTDENAGQMVEAVEMAYYLGNVRRLGFDLLRAQGRGGAVRAAAPEAVRQGMRAALQAAQKWRTITGKPLHIAQVERVGLLVKGQFASFAHCHAMTGEALFVAADGYLYACSSFVGDREFCIGHAASGIDAAAQRRVQQHIHHCMAGCRQCADFAHCGGGCFARWRGAGCGPEQLCLSECALKQEAIAWYQGGGKQERLR